MNSEESFRSTQEISKNLFESSKNPRASSRIPKNPKESQRILKNPKESTKILWKRPKQSPEISSTLQQSRSIPEHPWASPTPTRSTNDEGREKAERKPRERREKEERKERENGRKKRGIFKTCRKNLNKKRQRNRIPGRDDVSSRAQSRWTYLNSDNNYLNTRLIRPPFCHPLSWQTVTQSRIPKNPDNKAASSVTLHHPSILQASSKHPPSIPQASEPNEWPTHQTRYRLMLDSGGEWALDPRDRDSIAGKSSQDDCIHPIPSLRPSSTSILIDNWRFNQKAVALAARRKVSARSEGGRRPARHLLSIRSTSCTDSTRENGEIGVFFLSLFSISSRKQQ